MQKLFNKAKATISEHISNVFEEEELDKNSVVREFRTTTANGKNFMPFLHHILNYEPTPNTSFF